MPDNTTDTSEKGLESLIVKSLVEESGYSLGINTDFDRDHAVDLKQLINFLEKTQPEKALKIGLQDDSQKRRKFLDRLQDEITKNGIIDVLRKGINDGALSIDLFYGKPSSGNEKSQKLNKENIFSVTRQLRYSRIEGMLALDMAIFINGLPVITFELKNSLTKQTVDDAREQYKRDRDPRELIFQFGRCMVHFAVDDAEVSMCTNLKGKDSWFLPFNIGYNDGAGNPPNPDGLKTDYLWKTILNKDNLTDIIENYAQIVEKIDEKTGKKKREQIFPRYHQLDVVRKLLEDSKINDIGKKYLIQHSAGSGKSNSIAWLAYQLIGIKRDGADLFDSVIVVTDRRNLDTQIKNTIKRFAQVSSVVGHADNSGDLRQFLKSGKKIIITTVQKFPFILEEIGDEHRRNKFAIIIDEAHSSQGGRTAAKMNMVLSENTGDDSAETTEDRINQIMESRKMLANASYYAFTATPKNKTLEIFGIPYPADDVKKHRPFHSYTMKQAIQEGFILDVLQNYTPVYSYYRLMKKIEDDPEFDTKKAKKKLRRYVESHDYAIRQKAEIIADHFLESVIAPRKIDGQARAMVVCSGIERAIQYFHALSAYLNEIKSPFKAIVAFSGEHDFGGRKVTEAVLNEFPNNKIVEKIQNDPYRFLIVADKFQTGYDEPLLHTMYVDKELSGIKAVQTLSRLNRAHPKKYDTFVLDFMNKTEVIQLAFADYYRTTILSEETDPNKLHDLKSDLDGYQVYINDQIEELVTLYLNGADRDKLDPILDACVDVYNTELDEDGQVDFKGKSKTFIRTYNFLASILLYNNASWEKLSILLNFLIPKLPAPKDEDLSKGILESINMDSYRAEKKSVQKIILPDEDAEIQPVPASGGGKKPEPEMDRLSNIIKSFNDNFGNTNWTDKDKIYKEITEEIPKKVSEDKAFQNAIKNSDEQNARIEHDKALEKVIVDLLKVNTELYKEFMDNPDFKKWLSDINFNTTYKNRVA
jgi:type I restriction enzyme R subunit